MMSSSFPLERQALPMAIGSVGAVLAWLAGEPSGLLATAAAVGIVSGKRVSLLVAAIFALALGVSAIVGGWHLALGRQVNLPLIVFFAVGLGISALIHFVQTSDASGRDEGDAGTFVRQRSERELQQMIDTVPALIWCTTSEGIPCYLNKRVTDLTGLTLEDLIASDGSRYLAIVHPDEREVVDQALERAIAAGKPFVGRYRQHRATGPHRWVESRAEPLRDESGAIVRWYGVIVDIEDEIMAQEALRVAQDKLARAAQAASLSELSASIAHEVNQPLAAIVATSHACSRWLSADPPNLERAKVTLERIIRDANSASEVVSRIRALFSQLGKTRSPANIVDVIGDVRRLMAYELAAKNIQVEADLDRHLPQTLIDPVQIEQVLVNLVRNAIDALATIVDGPRQIRFRAVADVDNAIRVEVQDTGLGMKDPERAFEPFVTSKENGVGMGLAISRSIIESHNGRLWAVGNQPRGTTLVFTLPIQARDAA